MQMHNLAFKKLDFLIIFMEQWMNMINSKIKLILIVRKDKPVMNTC
jgi:hypothetical protein